MRTSRDANSRRCGARYSGSLIAACAPVPARRGRRVAVGFAFASQAGSVYDIEGGSFQIHASRRSRFTARRLDATSKVGASRFAADHVRLYDYTASDARRGSFPFHVKERSQLIVRSPIRRAGERTGFSRPSWTRPGAAKDFPEAASCGSTTWGCGRRVVSRDLGQPNHPGDPVGGAAQTGTRSSTGWRTKVGFEFRHEYIQYWKSRGDIRDVRRLPALFQERGVGRRPLCGFTATTRRERQTEIGSRQRARSAWWKLS
jgi:hypothetical protein